MAVIRDQIGNLIDVPDSLLPGTIPQPDSVIGQGSPTAPSATTSPFQVVSAGLGFAQAASGGSKLDALSTGIGAVNPVLGLSLKVLGSILGGKKRKRAAKRAREEARKANALQALREAVGGGTPSRPQRLPAEAPESTVSDIGAALQQFTQQRQQAALQQQQISARVQESATRQAEAKARLSETIRGSQVREQQAEAGLRIEAGRLTESQRANQAREKAAEITGQERIRSNDIRLLDDLFGALTGKGDVITQLINAQRIEAGKEPISRGIDKQTSDELKRLLPSLIDRLIGSSTSGPAVAVPSFGGITGSSIR